MMMSGNTKETAQGCALLIGIIIVIVLFYHYTKVMFGLVGVGVLILIGFEFVKNLIEKVKVTTETNSVLMQIYASEVVDICKNNYDKGDKIGLSPKYEAGIVQEKIWDVVRDISLNIQKLENTIEGINTKEDK